MEGGEQDNSVRKLLVGQSVMVDYQGSKYPGKMTEQDEDGES